jgi:uncharacterized membrane protein YphA (DoxX/SURF4 family)
MAFKGSKKASEKEAGWRLWWPHVLAGLVGLVLLAAALTKCADMELFVRQIKAYGIVSNRAMLIAAAWGMVVLEFVLGVALIIAYRIQLVLLATVLLLLLFLGVTGWAWSTGATEACGCFGAWLERTPKEAAVEDLVLIAFTGLAWAGFRGRQIRQARWKSWSVLAACVFGLALPAIFGFPFSGIHRSSSGTVETELGQFPIQGLGGIDVNVGSFLLVVMDTGCAHCLDVIPEINILAERPDLPPVVGLCVSSESERVAFENHFQPAFPVGQIDDDVFWRLLGDGDMPRTILVRDGYVKRVWDVDPPTAAAITTVSFHDVGQPGK